MNLARRALLVSGLIAAVAAAPAAALAGNHTVQIGGRLVAPEQLSAFEASAGTAPSTRLVQIGGRLVAPEQLSSFERSLSSPATGPAGSSGNDVTARNVGIASGALLVLALLLGASTLMRRRPRPIAA
ncbi:MAG: hypothetical protein ACJ747_06655 [Gaiellaceae bacterium]|jgi:hypothetical protein